MILVYALVFKVLQHSQQEHGRGETGRHMSFNSNSYLIGDFLGGTVDKNPPASAEDMSSIPGPGRFHMPKSN